MLPQLSAEQVHAALPWDALASALADAFMAPPSAPVRTAHALSPTDTLLLMPAWNAQAIGIKLVTVIPSACDHGGHTVDASYLVLDRLTGAPRAMLDGEALTVRRTAATSALAARAMAVAAPTSLLVVGTGRLAPWMARAYCALLPSLTEVRIWGRDGMKAGAVAHQLHSEGIPAIPVDTAALPAAVEQSALVSCVTTSTTPVVLGAWLQPGTHVDLVGGFTPAMREVDNVAIQRARIVVDRMDSALQEAGDLVQPLEAGVIPRAHIIGDLGALLRGETRARRSDDEITLFKSVGHALEDLAGATLAYSTHVHTGSR
ncbi:ornithine cyclodeaminase family protein [Gemmatimonas sp.]|uniref:ornithine cyclodeaminase family protein n=1 Tax=Gemmatimonas sp. TaxID=1962908 RepID=UPI003F7285F5